MTNAGGSVILVYLAVACELVIRQSVQGSGLEKQYQVNDTQVTEVRSTSKGACLATRTRVTGRNSWDCRSLKDGGCVCFECVCRCDRVSLLWRTTINFGMALLVKHNNKLGSMGDQASNSKSGGHDLEQTTGHPRTKTKWNQPTGQKNPRSENQNLRERKQTPNPDISPCCQLAQDCGGILASELLTTGSPSLVSKVRLWACLFRS